MNRLRPLATLSSRNVVRRFFPWSGALVLAAVIPFSSSAVEPAATTPPAAAEASAMEDDAMGDVTTLATLSVSGDRLEDFGFRVSPSYDPKRSRLLWSSVTPVVDVLLPNTAATKAGMRPGDRIVSADGKSTASAFFSSKKWSRIQEKKWAEVAAGKENVTWTLEVESAGTGERRTLTLRIPTPAPHWGATIWRAPEDRKLATVPEPGPLADKAGIVLNNGIWILLRGSYLRGFGLPITPEKPYFLCYQWTLWSGDAGHRIYVSQHRGRTDIILEAISRNARAKASDVAPTSAAGGLASATTVFAVDSRAYLTSPSGKLEKTWRLGGGAGQRAISPEDARAEFEAEKDFWIAKVGKVSARWPLGLITTVHVADHNAPVEGEASAERDAAKETAGADRAAPGTTKPVRTAAFLKLPPATAAQRALFNDALAQLGANEDRWAYTETARTIDDQRETVVRVDPSNPDEERCTLLRVNGTAATLEEVRAWREEGGDDRAPLGGLPPIDRIVDLSDVRVLSDDSGATVFELPMKETYEGLPADAFQAVFRVNKAHHGGLETITVKLRDAMRVATAAKLTEAGFTVKLRTIDPAFPPQVVSIEGGGALRVLLVKVARRFETTRTDFERVEPFVEPPTLAVVPEQ